MRFKKQIYGDPIVNAIIAECEGQKTHTRPYSWDCGGKKYSYITGGIVLPTFDTPGFLLTVGVNYDDNIVYCLDEFEDEDPYKLIKKAQEIQKEYGRRVISNWWGNPEELMSLVNEKNIKGNAVYISAPMDNDQKDAFQIYLARLRVGLSPTYQTFFINECGKMRNYISAFVPTGTEKPKNNPALYIAGSLLHTLLMMRPWEQAVERIELIPTTLEEYAAYEDKQAEKAIFAEVYGGGV